MRLDYEKETGLGARQGRMQFMSRWWFVSADMDRALPSDEFMRLHSTLSGNHRTEKVDKHVVLLMDRLLLWLKNYKTAQPTMLRGRSSKPQDSYHLSKSSMSTL